MESNAETLAVYPFDFSLEVKFQLSGKCLEISHEVHNLDSKEMFYSIGGHPAFNCPLLTGEELEDYFIGFPEIEKDSTWMIAEDGLIAEKGEKVLDFTREIPLHAHLFDKDALIFKNLKSNEVSLNHRKRGSVLRLEFEDFDYLGIWAKPGAPFVCLEPWLGIADSIDHSGLLAEKEGIRILAPGETETKIFRIWIEQ
jgi:galactose mutarotase-like enzyme